MELATWRLVFVLLLGVNFATAMIGVEEGKSIGAVSPTQSTLTSVYPFSVLISQDFYLFWKLQSESTIEVAVLFRQPNGWFSVGFGAYDDGHCRTDMIVGINGEVQDRYSTKEEEPHHDKANNIISATVNTTDEGQLMVFTRKLKTSDDYEDREIFTSMTTKVAWAWGPSNGGSMSQHPDNGYGILWVNFKTGAAYKYTQAGMYVIKFMFPLGFLLLCLLYVRVLASRPFLHFLHREYFLVHYFKYTLPEMLVIGGWLGANVAAFFVFYDHRKELGVSFAVPVEISIALLFLTVLKTPFFNRVYGISYEKQIKFHRFFSWVAVVAVLLHTIITLINFGSKKILAGEFKWQSNIFGAIACGIMVLIAALALRFVRRNRWEIFKFPHFLFYLFLAMGALHDINVIIFCAPGLGLYVGDRVYRLFMKFFHKPTLIEVDNRLPDITILRISFKRKYLAGQFVEIAFPEISKFESHPFSISSSPTEEVLTVHARSLGKWSHKIHDFSKATKIWVDGPYGLQPNWRKYDVIVLFAGGIGATPWISILRDHVLTPFLQRPAHLYFFPTFREVQHLAWFADTWEMASKDPSVHVTKYITKNDNDMEMLEAGGDRDARSGRPSYHELLSEICKTHAEAPRMLVMGCGPGRMIRELQSATYFVGHEHKKVIDFHSEVFKY